MAFIDREYDLDNASAEVSVSGNTVLNVGYSDFPPEIVKQGFLYGITKKMVDAVASIKGSLAKERSVETKDISDTDAEYVQAVISGLKEIYEQLKAGEWRAARGEGEAKPRVLEIAEAISRLRSMPIAEAEALCRGVEKEKLATWRKHPQIQLAIAQIRQERAAARLKAALEKEGATGDFDPNAL